MKNILLLISALASFPSLAQKQPLLRILTYHGYVTIAGQPVTPGQLIYDDNGTLQVSGKESYVNVLTEAGYTQRLASGNYSPAVINRESTAPKPRPSQRLDDMPWPITILTAPEAPYTKIFGDSVFLLWKVNQARKLVPPFTISVSSLFGDILIDTSAQNSSCALGVGPFLLQENKVLIQVKSSQSQSATKSEQHLVVRADEETRLRIQNDLKNLATNTATERAIARVAIFEINDLLYDLIYGLYQLRMAEKASGVPIVNNYYQRLIKKYGLDTL